MNLLMKYVAADACPRLPEHVTEQIHAKLNAMWKVPAKIRHSVAPCCVQLTRKNMHLLRNNLYTAAEKTNGERCLLLFMNIRDSDDPHGSSYPSMIFVDRSRTFLQVRGQAPGFMYSGTLLDGELIESLDGSGLEFRVFDVAAVGGVPIGFRVYIQRLKRARGLLKFLDKDLPFDRRLMMPSGITFTVKQPCLAQDLCELLRQIEALPDGSCDGIVFSPINRKIKTGTDYHTLKYKNGSPDIDLVLDADGHLWAGGNGRTLVRCDEEKQIADRGKFVLAPGTPAPNKGEVWQFLITRERGKMYMLRFQRARPEKKGRPNHARTVAAIMDEVKDDIKLQEIVDAVTSPHAQRRTEGRRGVEELMVRSSVAPQGEKEMTKGASTRHRNIERKKEEEERKRLLNTS